MVVDCGGGTVDITVHEIYDDLKTLKELYRASGCPVGSTGVDREFERLLEDIFGPKTIADFKAKMPSSYVDLMSAFESRKRSASLSSSTPHNLSLPFSFIQSISKWKGASIESLVKKYNDSDVSFDSELGILRIQPGLMRRFFDPVCEKIVSQIKSVLTMEDCQNIGFLFMVGGFAESQILQNYIKNSTTHQLKVIIPRGVSSATLRGAVIFGLDPSVVSVRRSRMTYGIGILNRFVHGFHPLSKLVVRDGIEWCTDVFDKFVLTDQSITSGDVVTRSYTPAKCDQKFIVLNIYCSEEDNVKFITDKGVQRCGALVLDLNELNENGDDSGGDKKGKMNDSNNESSKRETIAREIQTQMIFGDTEIKVQAFDVTSGRNVRAEIDFLSI